MQRDLEKKMLCQKEGITLIDVPYWWQSDKESLVATIAKYRPDVSSIKYIEIVLESQ
jgi:hypothetical protein